MRLFSASDCSGQPCDTATVYSGACGSFNTSSCHYYDTTPSTPDGGSCAPLIDASLPPAAWESAARACRLPSSTALVQGGCAAGQVCAPKPVAPFGAKLCIFATGDLPCPDGGAYTSRRVFYEAMTDTRSCGCRCGAPSGVTCSGGTVSLWNGTLTCQGGADQTDNLPRTACTGTNGGGFTADSTRTTGVVASGGSCAPSGYADGGVAPASPTTMCCQP